MSFLTVVESDIEADDTAALTGAKAVLGYIDNIVVTDLIPELETALQAALTKFSQQDLVPLINGLLT